MLGYQDFIVAQLLDEGLIDQATVDKAAAVAHEAKISLPEAIVREGVIGSREMAIIFAMICECPYVDLDHFVINFHNARRLPRPLADRHLAFPLFELGGVLTVAMADPLDLEALDQIRQVVQMDVEPVLAEPAPLRGLINRAYSMLGGEASAAEEFAVDDAEGPIINAVNQILHQAAEEGASDVHINPDDRELHLRFRIDGALQVRQGPPRSSHAGIIQRLKVMAGLDLTESRRPQDGKFRFRHGDKSVDIRMSVLPTIYGENAVLRLLATNAQIKSFEELGFTSGLLKPFMELLSNPYGMVLVTGPTGSGKTTTLYAALSAINTPDRNIMTIEDPVEIRLPMVRQTQVNHQVGLTFARVLRAVLRQDPDVVLVGEIRDDETATIATQAALTGHLVFSTLHTNDAAGALPRLRNLGVPAFATNAALLGVLAQRLIRRVCQDCAAPGPVNAVVLRRFGLNAGERFRAGVGCPRCLGTGFKGRIGLYELMRMDDELRAAIDRQAGIDEFRRIASHSGMRPMWQDGVEKARIGLTTLDEVSKAVSIEQQYESPVVPGELRAAA